MAAKESQSELSYFQASFTFHLSRRTPGNVLGVQVASLVAFLHSASSCSGSDDSATDVGLVCHCKSHHSFSLPILECSAAPSCETATFNAAMTADAYCYSTCERLWGAVAASASVTAAATHAHTDTLTANDDARGRRPLQHDDHNSKPQAAEPKMPCASTRGLGTRAEHKTPKNPRLCLSAISRRIVIAVPRTAVHFRSSCCLMTWPASLVPSIPPSLCAPQRLRSELSSLWVMPGSCIAISNTCNLIG